MMTSNLITQNKLSMDGAPHVKYGGPKELPIPPDMALNQVPSLGLLDSHIVYKKGAAE